MINQQINPHKPAPLGPNQVNQLLSDRGILPTQQRVLIARALFTQHRHLSADQVLTMVNRPEHRVSKATVYNTLGLFAREGLVREVIVDPSRVFYDPNTDPHHHFYNVDTGELIDIPLEQVSVDSLPKTPAGTVAERVDVVVRIRNSD